METASNERAKKTIPHVKNPSSLPHSHSHDDGFATMLGEDKGEDSTPCRDRLLLWLAGPYELTQETPSRPLYEPFGTAQNTAASSCSGEATQAQRVMRYHCSCPPLAGGPDDSNRSNASI